MLNIKSGGETIEQELKAVKAALDILATMERELEKLQSLIPQLKGTEIAPLVAHYGRGLDKHHSEIIGHLEVREAELRGEED